MKTQARIWLVVLALFVAVGVVYALSSKTPPGQSKLAQTATTIPVAEQHAPATSSAENTAESNKLASAQQSTPVSLSPDLAHTDAFGFLDPVSVGKKAPDFTATTADGKTIQLSDF